jgi:5-methylcytosine-specific restriction endonuclease McrA
MAKPFARAFYKSPAWRTARQAALRRDGYTCQRCGDRATEVHHIIELTPDNINDPRIALALNNLESLCHTCHTKETQDTADIISGFYFDENGQAVPM